MHLFSPLPTRVFLLSGLALAIGTSSATAQTSEKPVTVERCRVMLIDEVMLASPVPGVLDLVLPSEGDTVEAEQVVASLQDDVIEAQKKVALKEAENDVEKRYAVKATEVAEAEYQKALEANRRVRNSVAAMELERLKLAAERARLQIEQAEHQLDINQLKAEEADANLRTYHIKAPFKGVVTQKFKSRGEAVRQGDAILEIISTDEVKVEGYVTVDESFEVQRGDQVKVTLELPGGKQEKPFDGVLTLVAQKVEPVSGRVRVSARVQNPNNILKAGLTATMQIFPQKGAPVQTTQVTR